MLHSYLAGPLGATPHRLVRRRGPQLLAGLGATSDWDAFKAGGTSATYEDPSRIVYCKKDRANGAQCWLEAETTVARRQAGAVAAMQRAADAVLNQAKGLHMSLVRQGLQFQVTQPDGSVRSLPSQDWELNPILAQAGYDGIVGSQTRGLVVAALLIAGSLNASNMPSGAFAAFSSGRESDLVFYAQQIAEYLNYTATNWAGLEQSYRDRVTASQAIVPEVVPAVAAALYQKKPFPLGLAIGGGLVALALVVGVGYAIRKPQMTEEMY